MRIIGYNANGGMQIKYDGVILGMKGYNYSN